MVCIWIEIGTKTVSIWFLPHSTPVLSLPVFNTDCTTVPHIWHSCWSFCLQYSIWCSCNTLLTDCCSILAFWDGNSTNYTLYGQNTITIMKDVYKPLFQSTPLLVAEQYIWQIYWQTCITLQRCMNKLHNWSNRASGSWFRKTVSTFVFSRSVPSQGSQQKLENLMVTKIVHVHKCKFGSTGWVTYTNVRYFLSCFYQAWGEYRSRVH